MNRPRIALDELDDVLPDEIVEFALDVEPEEEEPAVVEGALDVVDTLLVVAVAERKSKSPEMTTTTMIRMMIIIDAIDIARYFEKFELDKSLEN